MGKSTVVNRLARRFKDGSIVFDEAGVTRDRTYKRAWYCGKDFDVVDTGGLVFDDRGEDVFAKEVYSRRIEALPRRALVCVCDFSNINLLRCICTPHLFLCFFRGGGEGLLSSAS